MAKWTNFFALKEDLLLVLDELESNQPVKYVLCDNFAIPKSPEWFRGSDIPELGIAHGEQSVLCRSYLMSEWHDHTAPRSFQVCSGETRFSIDQSVNPNTIQLNPGGRWRPNVVIAGFFATVSESPVSESLMRLSRRLVKKHFKRVNAFWVGPSALAGFTAGWRLTQAEQSPSEFDLRT